MTGDGWLRAGTLMSIGVSLVILTRFVVAVGRAFVTGLVSGYRRENAARDSPEEPPDEPPASDTDALLDRVDATVRALRTSTILLTVTTDSLATALAAAAESRVTNPFDPDTSGAAGAPAASPCPAPDRHSP